MLFVNFVNIKPRSYKVDWTIVIGFCWISLEGPVHAKRCSTTCHWCQKTQPHHACAKSVALAPVRQRVKLKTACLVQQLLSGQTPSYLAADI